MTQARRTLTATDRNSRDSAAALPGSRRRTESERRSAAAVLGSQRVSIYERSRGKLRAAAPLSISAACSQQRSVLRLVRAVGGEPAVLMHRRRHGAFGFPPVWWRCFASCAHISLLSFLFPSLAVAHTPKKKKKN